jgi:xylan 1,4-beta-xylosidase
MWIAKAQAPRRIQGDMDVVKGARDTAFRFCVGSERAGVLLRPENMQQLAEVHRTLGFEYIRFHGIFHDDMDVYHEIDGQPVYDFSRVDRLYDQILALGMKPFVELSFMPQDLASGNQKIFFWNANVTPPKDIHKWSALVEAFVEHLKARYGHDRVKSWYFEVWNEPNYPGFWPNADQAAYFKLYDATVAAIKKVSVDYRVGGPATAGAGWVPEFIAHTAQSGAPVDFISTHTYAVSQGFLDADGNADLVLSQSADAIVGDVKNVRAQIDASVRPKLPLHITEWSASYSSRDPVHDSYTSAAFILQKLKQVEGHADSMSYWTYTDLFEENGPPPAAFHGGFGLLTRDDIPKPAFYAYKYLNQLGAVELKDSDKDSWLTRNGSDAEALLWNYTMLRQEEGDKAFFRKLHPSLAAAPVVLQLDHLTPGRYQLAIYRTGFQSNDAYSAYIKMGLPKDLSPEEIRVLKNKAADVPESTTEVRVGADSRFVTTVKMQENDIVFISLKKR